MRLVYFRMRVPNFGDDLNAVLWPALARRRPPYFWHDVGTARMGADPAESVVDPTGQVHGVRGLYAIDASTLPTAGAVNTALTIVALALRMGDRIAGPAAAGHSTQHSASRSDHAVRALRE